MKFFVDVEDFWEVEAEDAEIAKEIILGEIASSGVTLRVETATELRRDDAGMPPCEKGTS